MKFTDGYWKVREGYRPHHPREIYETETDGRSVTLYGPTMRVRDPASGAALAYHPQCLPRERR